MIPWLVRTAGPRRLGTEAPASAQIHEKRTQFADIGPVLVARENPHLQGFRDW
jgi:hypothetical protein